MKSITAFFLVLTILLYASCVHADVYVLENGEKISLSCESWVETIKTKFGSYDVTFVEGVIVATTPSTKTQPETIWTVYSAHKNLIYHMDLVKKTICYNFTFFREEMIPPENVVSLQAEPGTKIVFPIRIKGLADPFRECELFCTEHQITTGTINPCWISVPKDEKQPQEGEVPK